MKTHRHGLENFQMMLDLETMLPSGDALSRFGGVQVSTFGGIPGEQVYASVVRDRGTLRYASVDEVLEPSPYRKKPECPYFGACTGCQWQHIKYEHQLDLKRAIVREALDTAGIPSCVVTETLAAVDEYGYRNHARFTVGPAGRLGFVHKLTRRFVQVERCLLMHPWINQVLARLQGHCAETTQIAMRYGMNTGKWLLQPLLKNVDAGIATGQPNYCEALSGNTFRISASSFFQVNTQQAEQLIDLMRERLGMDGRGLLVDAYSGVGTFARVFSPMATRVLAVEESPNAVRDALANLRDVPNVELVRNRTELVLDSLVDRARAVILDPPRTGCHPATLQAILRRPPDRVLYVSCEPETLARDLKVLLRGPFRLEEVVPVDFFPHTRHVECLATLTREHGRQWSLESRQELILASKSPRRQEILKQLGLSFRVMAPGEEDDEGPLEAGSDPVVVAVERATSKAHQVAARLTQGIVIGADTVVVHDQELMGKPSTPEEARYFLGRLRGREHRVITGLAVVDAATGEEVTAFRRTRVFMRPYTDEEIGAYIASGEAWDKAGGYAIQDPRFRPVKGIKGCYLNVVGLPPCRLLGLLQSLGLHPVLDQAWSPPGNCPDCHRLVPADEGRKPR